MGLVKLKYTDRKEVQLDSLKTGDLFEYDECILMVGNESDYQNKIRAMVVSENMTGAIRKLKQDTMVIRVVAITHAELEYVT